MRVTRWLPGPPYLCEITLLETESLSFRSVCPIQKIAGEWCLGAHVSFCKGKSKHCVFSLCSDQEYTHRIISLVWEKELFCLYSRVNQERVDVSIDMVRRREHFRLPHWTTKEWINTGIKQRTKQKEISYWNGICVMRKNNSASCSSPRNPQPRFHKPCTLAETRPLLLVRLAALTPDERSWCSFAKTWWESGPCSQSQCGVLFALVGTVLNSTSNVPNITDVPTMKFRNTCDVWVFGNILFFNIFVKKNEMWSHCELSTIKERKWIWISDLQASWSEFIFYFFGRLHRIGLRHRMVLRYVLYPSPISSSTNSRVGKAFVASRSLSASLFSNVLTEKIETNIRLSLLSSPKKKNHSSCTCKRKEKMSCVSVNSVLACRIKGGRQGKDFIKWLIRHRRCCLMLESMRQTNDLLKAQVRVQMKTVLFVLDKTDQRVWPGPLIEAEDAFYVMWLPFHLMHEGLLLFQISWRKVNNTLCIYMQRTTVEELSSRSTFCAVDFIQCVGWNIRSNTAQHVIQVVWTEGGWDIGTDCVVKVTRYTLLIVITIQRFPETHCNNTCSWWKLC